MAGWATATGRGSCCRRRSRPWLASLRVVALSAGYNHSIALTADGGAYTWGKGERGCLGHGEDVSNQLLPKKVEAWPPSTPASA